MTSKKLELKRPAEYEGRSCRLRLLSEAWRNWRKKQGCVSSGGDRGRAESAMATDGRTTTREAHQRQHGRARCDCIATWKGANSAEPLRCYNEREWNIRTRLVGAQLWAESFHGYSLLSGCCNQTKHVKISGERRQKNEYGIKTALVIGLW